MSGPAPQVVSGLGPTGAYEIAVPDRLDLDDRTGVGGIDHVAAPYVHAGVGHPSWPATPEEQVARLETVERDVGYGVVLCLGGARDPYSGSGPRPLGEPQQSNPTPGDSPPHT